ncbi:unnamed protein product [Discula destructiva]
MRRALRFDLIFKGQSLKKMYRDSPGETSFAVAILIAVFACAMYTVYMYFTYFYAEQFTKYPDDVANSLRRALYYSNYQVDPELALKYYKKALQQCAANGLDPFSDDVVGIKIQLASWLENKLNDIRGAVKVLDIVLKENKEWLDLCAKNPEKLPRAPAVGTVIGEGESARTITKEDFEHWFWAARNRVLLKSVQISIKLGELNAHDQVLERDISHDHLMWGVETLLKETRRRASEGVKDGEGPWITQEEIGGALESLAHSYERNEQFDLAVPLFFQALRLCQDQCHMAVIMNNLAVSFAQHPPRPPYETLEGIVPGETSPATAPSPTSDLTWTRKEFLNSAQRWAKNALSHAKEPTGDKRTPECDSACAVALINLGDIAAMSGDHKQARTRYERAIKVSEDKDFADGVAQAQAGLKRLQLESSK